MKWETHQRITRYTWEKLELPKQWIGPVCNASILPDEKREKELKKNKNGEKYYGKVPHHTPDPDRIMKHVWNARLSILKGEKTQFVKSLGYALHYIQDGMLSTYKKGLFFEHKSYEEHDRREEELQYIPVPSNENFIDRCANTVIKTPHELEKMIQNVSPKKNLEKIMFLATAYSLVTLNAIVNSNPFPKKYKREYLYYAKRHATLLLVSALISLFITLPLVYFSSGFFVVLPPLIVYSVHKMDVNYIKSAEIARWYNKKRPLIEFLFR